MMKKTNTTLYEAPVLQFEAIRLGVVLCTSAENDSYQTDDFYEYGLLD